MANIACVYYIEIYSKINRNAITLAHTKNCDIAVIG